MQRTRRRGLRGLGLAVLLIACGFSAALLIGTYVLPALLACDVFPAPRYPLIACAALMVCAVLMTIRRPGKNAAAATANRP